MRSRFSSEPAVAAFCRPVACTGGCCFMAVLCATVVLYPWVALFYRAVYIGKTLAGAATQRKPRVAAKNQRFQTPRRQRHAFCRTAAAAARPPAPPRARNARPHRLPLVRPAPHVGAARRR